MTFASAAFDSGRVVERDTRTGREVWRLTSGSATSFAPYMYRRAFTHDEQYVVFSSDRTGRFQIYRVEIKTGEARQLTEADYVITHMATTLDPAGREAYLITQTGVLAVDVFTGEARRVMDTISLTGGEPIHSFTLTQDGRNILVHYHRSADGRTAIAIGDTQGRGKLKEVYVFPDGIERVTHTLFCPTDPDILTYNRQPDRQNEMHLGPAERARCWKLDLRTGEDVPFLVMPVGYRATHEYWAPDGSCLYFHRKTQPGWVPASIGSIPKDGGEATLGFTSNTIKLGHSSVNTDRSRIVSDSQEPGENPLLLIDTATGKAEILCWPNASGAPHPNHVHPAFSPSGRYIVYTSDVTGSAQVYIVPLER